MQDPWEIITELESNNSRLFKESIIEKNQVEIKEIFEQETIEEILNMNEYELYLNSNYKPGL